jgi:hypothetical protein
MWVDGGLAVKVAVTDLLEVIFRVQEPLPLQPPPDQPPKLDPARGEAVKVTVEPALYFLEQVPGQAIPPPDTAPEPVPASTTLRRCSGAHVLYLRFAAT